MACVEEHMLGIILLETYGLLATIALLVALIQLTWSRETRIVRWLLAVGLSVLYPLLTLLSSLSRFLNDYILEPK